MQNAEILAAIDELNQYLNGNVTKTSLQITISDLINKLQYLQTKYEVYWIIYT